MQNNNLPELDFDLDIQPETNVMAEIPEIDFDLGDDVEVSTTAEYKGVMKTLAKKELALPEGDIVGTPTEEGFIQVRDVAGEREQIASTRADVQEQARAKGLALGEIEEPGMEPTLDLLDIVPALGALGAGIYKALKFLRPIPGKQLKVVKEWVDKDPQLATDILEAVHFAKKYGIDMPAEMWTEQGELVKTGNALLDTKLTNMKNKYKGIEYDTLNNLINSVHKTPISTEEAALAWRKSMDAAYSRYNTEAKTKWDTFNQLANSQNIQLSKVGQKQLASKLDASMPNAPGLVKNFIKNTIYKAKEEGKIYIGQLQEESNIIFNQLKQYNRKNLSKAEKEQKKVLGQRLRLKQREIAEAENELNNQPLTLNDLVEARKLMNNKIYVQGGAISTKNTLERNHIESAIEVIEDQINSMAKPETMNALEEARRASRKTFDTFGHNLSGKNLGVETNMSGKVLKENEVGIINEFEKELLNNNFSQAKTKFAKYSELLGKDSEAISQAKRVYADKVFGLDVSEMTTVKGLDKLKLEDGKLRAGLNKALGTEEGRALTKEIFGEEGFKDLIAIRKLDDLVKQKLPEGDTTLWKEATSAFDKSLVGALIGTLKLIKSYTWDVAAYPLRDKGRMANRQIINKLTKELEKKGHISPASEGKIRQFIREWDERMQSGGYTADEMGEAAGGGAPGKSSDFSSDVRMKEPDFNKSDSQINIELEDFIYKNNIEDALSSYTEYGFQDINRAYLAGDSSELSSYMKVQKELLDSLWSQQGNYAGISYRGTRLDEDKLASLSEGDLIETRMPLSTSKHEESAEVFLDSVARLEPSKRKNTKKVFLKIDSDRNPQFDVTQFSQHPYEAEVLISPKSVLQVESIDKSKNVVEIELSVKHPRWIKEIPAAAKEAGFNIPIRKDLMSLTGGAILYEGNRGKEN